MTPTAANPSTPTNPHGETATRAMSDAEVSFVLLVTRVTDRKAALFGKRTSQERRELMRALILEYRLADEIAPMPGDAKISYRNWFSNIYPSRKRRAEAT